MLNYKDFINESLNSPVKFWMTEDTKLPIEIYGAFRLDDTDYGMSLIKTNKEKIYSLALYRIISKKVRFWSFKKPTHIRPALSTLIKFVEATLPFMKNRFDGVIASVPSSKGGEKINFFAERLIKRTFITSFRFVKTEKSTESKLNHVFFIRKQVVPAILFSSKSFRDYTFVNDEVPSAALDSVELAKRHKVTVTTERSKRQFKTLFINDDIRDENSDLFRRIDNIKPIEDIEIKRLEDTKLIKDTFLQIIDTLSILRFNDKEKFLKLLDIPKQDKRDEEKVKSHVLTFISNNVDFIRKDPNFLRDKIISLDFNSASKILDIESQISKIVNNGVDFKEKNVDELTNVIFEIEDLRVTDLPPADPELYPIEFDDGGFITSAFISTNEILNKRTASINKIYEMPIENLLEKEKEAIIGYTGIKSLNINSLARTRFEDIINNNFDDYKKSLESFESLNDFITMTKTFDKVPRLPEPIWVHRSTNIPESINEQITIGFEYIDPAFLSTSLKPIEKFGNDNMAIYLPKGTPVLSVNTISKFPSELEIILQPFSVLKVIRIQSNFSSFSRKSLFMVYTGSAAKSFIERVPKEFVREEIDVISKYLDYLNEAKSNDKDKDNENFKEKFSSFPSKDPKFFKKIQDMIKDGRLRKDK